MPFISKLVGIATLVGGGSYLILCGLAWIYQTHLIFSPSRSVTTTPADFNLAYETIWLPVAGSRLHSWWIPSNPGDRVLLFLHGNSINISANLTKAQGWHQAGFSVLLVDYRGYGYSGGPFPNEARVYADAETAWQYLTQTLNIPPGQIYVFGHSLGGAIAVELASRHPHMAGLILEGTFTSIADMAKHMKQYRIFPTWLLNQRFDTFSKVHTLKVPMLFIHGTADEVIPASMTQVLFEAAGGPKQLIMIPDGGHNNLAEMGEVYWQSVEAFLQGHESHQSLIP